MDSLKLSVPGKVFLLGEYAVLVGETAWIITVAPRFTWESNDLSATRFHPESPAGRFLSQKCELERTPTFPRGKFLDPWEGRGGFGGSTAEFALVVYMSGVRDATEAWNIYRALSKKENASLRPSGADLVAQWLGGMIEWNPSTEKASDLTRSLSGFPVLLFSATHLANRKTVTHAHLNSITNGGVAWDSLRPSLARAKEAMKTKNWTEMGHAFSAFADSLAHLGLESPVVRNERLALSRLPGVLGVKGCGSMQTDAMVVIVESLRSEITNEVIRFAQEECGLMLLSRGLPEEPGIREDA